MTTRDYETDGPWQSRDAAAFHWLSFRRLRFLHDPAFSCWFDVHATRKSPGPASTLGHLRAAGAVLSDEAVSAYGAAPSRD
jgi:hypothetical protein